MRIYDDLSRIQITGSTVLTIGAFDGVHRGHQQLIRQMVAEARHTGSLAAVLTFHPHPAAVLSPEDSPKYLTTLGQKAVLFEELGVDLLVILPFDQHLANMPAYDFIRMIQQPLRAREIWVGADFAFGRGREGNVLQLGEWGKELGFVVRVVPKYVDGDKAISSTRIRQLIHEGRVDEAALLLNRYYSLAGEVVHGTGRGHNLLKIPTANLEVKPDRAIPADGIYAVFAVLGEERYKGVANIGRRPSFDNGQRTIEVHILDFQEDIYGCDLVVEFVQWLRPEFRYERCEDLVTQIQRDIKQAREILAREQPYPRPLVPLRCQPMCSPSENHRTLPRFEELSYTADIGIRAFGSDLKELYENAAYGMFALLADVDGLVATTEHQVEVEAPDREALLVSWLDELLYLHDTTNEVFLCFHIEELSETHLRAVVRGTRLSDLKLEIKAVTYHDLKIEHENGRYMATVVFDI